MYVLNSHTPTELFMSNTTTKRKAIESRERDFLEACGFDLKNGFFSEDVDHWKAKEPDLYRDYVVLG